MKMRTRGVKRKMRTQWVPMGHPDRSQFIVDAMRRGLCPECQAHLIPSTDADLDELQAEGAEAWECPRCHWQGVLGGAGDLSPYPEI